MSAELTPEGRPSIPEKQIGRAVKELYGLEGTISPLPAEWDQNFLLDAGDNGMYVVKVAHSAHSTEVLDFQNAVLDRLSRTWKSGKNPDVVPTLSGDKIGVVTAPGGSRHHIRLLTYLSGQSLSTVEFLSPETLDRLGFAIGECDKSLLDFRHSAMDRHHPWDLRRAEWIISQTRSISDSTRRGILERIFLQYRARVVPLLGDLPISVVHNDANDENILLAPHPDGGWDLSGLLDYGDIVRTHTVNNLAILCAYVILRSSDPLRDMEQVLKGYCRARTLSETELKVIFPLACIRLCVSVTMSAIAAHDDPHNEHRQITDRPAWKMLETLEHIDWLEAEDRFRAVCSVPPRLSQSIRQPHHTHDVLLHERQQRIGPSLRLSYKKPLEIIHGRGQFLFDRDGRAYLDCVNNICHVGHSHPRIVAALSEQAALLNTNTRYLHPHLIEYATRLTATLPAPLRVCFFVNSGSEANELAVRMARIHTGRRDVIVIDHAYHGNTQTLIDLSPYKCEGPGGQGLAAWAHKVPMPDSYRGPERRDGSDAGHTYAENVRNLCRRLLSDNRPPALFLCEPILAAGGHIVPPPGFFQESFDHIRSAGGVCIVDEVQVGMGRTGSHMWGFQWHGVVPDIVTLGKPIGNGHPIGAVITTPEIARSFDNGMEFFSSFGGNPVSMKVGLAVLDVLEEERLMERASRVGQYLADGFRSLAGHHPEIGDVRGLGMFIGVDLVTDRDSRAPATGITHKLIERVKADGILLSAEGPHHNVLKIKPPLQFLEPDADLLLGAVDRGLRAIRAG